MKKQLILVTSPPACGKTYVSEKLSETLKPIIYLDKDTVIPLSEQVYKAAGVEVNRSGDFFETYLRDPEYIVTVNFALEALKYADLCLINAPFTRELAFEKQHYIDYMADLQKRLHEMDGELTVIFIQCDPEVVRQRMIDRNSDRDWWKIQNWEEYNKGRDYNPPEKLAKSPIVDNFYVVENNGTPEKLAADLQELARKIRGEG